MKMNNSLVGKRIAQLRKSSGLSQLMLSEMIDRSPTHLSYIETGAKSMSLETFVRIANALNASADELLIDLLNNTNVASAHAFSSLLSDCSEYEKQVLLDTLLATKGALRSHLHLLGKHYV